MISECQNQISGLWIEEGDEASYLSCPFVHGNIDSGEFLTSLRGGSLKVVDMALVVWSVYKRSQDPKFYRISFVTLNFYIFLLLYEERDIYQNITNFLYFLLHCL